MIIGNEMLDGFARGDRGCDARTEGISSKCAITVLTAGSYRSGCSGIASNPENVELSFAGERKKQA